MSQRQTMNGAPPANPRSNGAVRFTLDGSDGLEHRLTRLCEKVLAGVRKIIPSRKLDGLLLGGGYGRGEGGVLKIGAEDFPYNDLEFYVFIRGNNWLNERLFARPLHHLEQELTLVAGVEVEFKIVSRAKLRRRPASMFYYDLATGHRRLLGEKKLLAGCDHQRDARNIPLSEATRLLMNRCSGLLFARERIEHEPFAAEDADFVGRNLAKAQMAIGDAVLAALGQYHWSRFAAARTIARAFREGRFSVARRGAEPSCCRREIQTASAPDRLGASRPAVAV